MQTIINALRDLIGIDANTFYRVISGYSDKPTWDYGAMLEYACAVMVVLIVVSSVFKFLRGVFGK